jgi:RNA polymerase sigma-70 factor (ECF subfamily)
MRNFEEPGNAAADSTAPAPDGWKAEREAFWDDIRPRLQVYLRSFSGLSPEDAEEALQLTLVEFWRRAPGLGADARAWLYRVARNAAIDALRSGRRRGARIAPSMTGERDAPVDLPSPYPGPEARLLDLETEAFVARFLGGLDDRDRELLHLAFAEDFSYPAIASLTGRPLGTVKWKIAGLKRRLAERYRKEFE